MARIKTAFAKFHRSTAIEGYYTVIGNTLR
jgi:hypothetical protein